MNRSGVNGHEGSILPTIAKNLGTAPREKFLRDEVAPSSAHFSSCPLALLCLLSMAKVQSLAGLHQLMSCLKPSQCPTHLWTWGGP